MSVQSQPTVYRLYWINGRGHVDAVATPIQALCDAEAVRQAQAIAEGDRVELWQGRRLVVQIEAIIAPRLLQ